MSRVGFRRIAVALAVSTCVLAGLPSTARADVAPDPGGDPTDRTPPLARTDKYLGFNTRWATAPENEAELIRRASGKIHRWTISWEVNAPTSGAQFPSQDDVPLDPNDPDDRLYLADLGAGLTPMIVVLDAPMWASRYTNCGINVNCLLYNSLNQNNPGYFIMPPGPNHVPAYANFVKRVAIRYPAAIIETWNEPNEGSYWRDRYPQGPSGTENDKGKPSPGLMASMQCAALDAINNAGLPNLVAGPGIGAALAADADTMRYYDFVTGVIQHPNPDRICWDIHNIHSYPGKYYQGAGTLLAQHFQVVRERRGALGDTTPIWLTEIGVATAPSVTQDEQNKFHIEAVHKLLDMPDVYGVVVHTLVDNWGNSGPIGMLTTGLAPKNDVDGDSGGYCHFASFLPEPTPAGCP